MSIDRRLTVAESVLGQSRPWTVQERSMFTWLSEPSLAVVVEKEARTKSERRWLHENNRVAGRPTTPDGRGWTMTVGDGWLWSTSDTERAELARREHGDLQSLLRLFSLHYAAIRVWLAEAEEHGWPRLHPDGYEDNFVDKLARHRKMMAAHRGGKDPIAVEWRRQHPGWRAAMTPDEYDSWELTLPETEVMNDAPNS
ncbi:hypothetical protein BH23CHL4_BH23CHL4_29440 [soil metagenome]